MQKLLLRWSNTCILLMAILPILCLSTIFLVLNSILINDEFFVLLLFAIAMIALCITVKLDINEQKSRKNIHRK